MNDLETQRNGAGNEIMFVCPPHLTQIRSLQPSIPAWLYLSEGEKLK